LFVAGEEAGGNLAAGLALMCRDRLRPKLAGQVLLSPMLDPRLGTCSVRAAEAGTAGCKWAAGWHEYLRTQDTACHPYAAPSAAMRLAGLAPALLLTGPNDPMADEAAAYAARLQSSGVAVVERRISCGAAWPDALLGAAATPPWADAVRAAASEFFHACTHHY
jgi:acetyl esterase/lipase